MSFQDFATTRNGQDFLVNIARIAKALERLAKAIEDQNANATTAKGASTT